MHSESILTETLGGYFQERGGGTCILRSSEFVKVYRKIYHKAESVDDITISLRKVGLWVCGRGEGQP
jgi:hypothetical protein